MFGLLCRTHETRKEDGRIASGCYRNDHESPDMGVRESALIRYDKDMADDIP